MRIEVLASGSSGNCTYISDGATALLLDAGLPYTRIQTELWGLGLKIEDISGVLVTHEHGDHAKAAKDFARRMKKVVMSKGTEEALNLQQVRSVAALKPMFHKTIGTFIVVGFPVEHDAAEPFGFWIISEKTNETLLFVTDTQFVRYKFYSIDYLLIECNYVHSVLEDNVRSGALPYGRRVEDSHMSLDTLEELIKSLGPHPIKEIHVLHLSDKNSDEAFIEERIQAVSGSLVFVH